MTTANRRRSVALAAALLLASPSLARAQTSATDRALAQSLFDEARRLMGEGKFAEACPKFAESQRLDPGGGTLINLALCHEKEGKTASAWSEFNEALGQARRDGRQDREASARERIAALEPRLVRLAIDVPQTSRVEGLVIKLDGVTVGAAGFGNPFPVDPGAHVVEASAPMKRAWNTRVEAAASSSTLRVSVPLLDDDPEARARQQDADTRPSPSPSQPLPPEDKSSTRTLGLVIGGVGVASLAVGAIFGVQALSKRSDSDQECPADRCTAKGVKLNEDAITAAWIANVGVGLGLVGVGVGGYLFLSSRDGTAGNTSPSARRLRLAPQFGARSGGLVLQGSLD